MMARATTKTKTENEQIADEPELKGEVAIFQPARLPYHPAIEERYGVDKGQWKVLVEAIFPAAKSVDAIVMALGYCKSRNLDVFKRPVHIVPMWDSAKGGYVETIWPGISELRTTASRTKGYAGIDEAEFGPITKFEFKGRVKRNGNWVDETVTLEAPAWCRMTVYRIVEGTRCKFVGPKVVWGETYASQGNSDLPNKMWQERPEGQIEKCAEAGALRRAFPEEMGNELTAEEMTGRNVHEVVTTVEPALIATDRDNAPPRDPPKVTEQPARPPAAGDGEVRDGSPPRAAPKADPISSGPQRDAAPPRQAAGQAKPAAAKPASEMDGGSSKETQPHRIPGDGHSFESWTDRYCDLLRTSPDVATVYGWVDANTREYTDPKTDKRLPGPLTRLQKGKPSVYAIAKKATEETIQSLRPKDDKPADKPKAAPKSEPKTSDMEDGPGPIERTVTDMNPENVLKHIDAELSAVEDADQLQAVWDSAVEPLLKDLFPPDVDEAQALFQKHEKRLGGD